MEEIIGEYYDDIYKYCYWRIKNSTEAQDITQETFLRFMQNLSTYIDMGKPKALLYTIARNLCINWQKKPSHYTGIFEWTIAELSYYYGCYGNYYVTVLCLQDLIWCCNNQRTMGVCSTVFTQQ